MYFYKPAMEFYLLPRVLAQTKSDTKMAVVLRHKKKNTIVAVMWLLPVRCNLFHAAQSLVKSSERFRQD